jgi:hypothetical protein
MLSKGLKCMYTNVDTFNSKRIELKARIAEANPDIVGLTEINPKNAKWELLPQDIALEVYVAFTNFTGRGSVLYVRESLASSGIKPDEGCEACTWCEVSLRNHDKLTVGLIYRSPSSSDLQNRQLITIINEKIQKGNSHVMIMGDLNFPEIDWDLEVSTVPGEHISHDFMTACKDWFLYQHVHQPTRHRQQQKANILDLLFTNEKGMIEQLTYREPIGSSDHMVLNWTLRCYVAQPKSTVVKYLYDKGNYDEMRRRLGQEDWNYLMHEKNVDEMWTLISGKVEEIVNELVPHRSMFQGTTRRRKPVWMNERVLGRIKKKRTAFSRYLETKDGIDYLEYTKARNTAKAEVRRAVRDYEKEIAKKAKKDPKSFYKFVNNSLKTRSRIAELKKEDGTEVSSDGEKAETFNSFFGSVFTVEDRQNMPEGIKVTVQQYLNDIQFSEQEILQLLLKVNVNKSPGPDNIHPRIMKECAAELSGPLFTLFRASLNEGVLPQAWKEGNITPIFKKGSRSEASNYRPVSLTSVCCKIFEKIIRDALLHHMITNRFLSNSQHRFIKGRSCMTQLLQVIDKWTEILDSGGAVDSIYLDFAKAFDTVPHHRLLLKLESYGVGGRMLEWNGYKNFCWAESREL